MPTIDALHAYLTGLGRDDRGRLVSEVLAFSDQQLEDMHDYIQWLFPLPTRSAAQPTAPVLTDIEMEKIRKDARATGTLIAASERMLRFYRDTHSWLRTHDHNHLRITRIIRSLRLLVSLDAARSFHRTLLILHDDAGNPVNASSLRFWAEALRD